MAVENPRGWRIAKEKASKKIDAIVALAMACVAAMAHRGEIGSRSARGFNRACTFRRKRSEPDGGPLYVGQNLVDVPATVIAQQSSDGAMRVLASFASEGMSLRRHAETIVKPWINANARQCHIWGTFEKIDGQTEWDLIQIVEDAIGGSWQTTEAGWEARRDAVSILSARPHRPLSGLPCRLMARCESSRRGSQRTMEL